MKLLFLTLIPLLAAILGALGGSQNSSKLFRRIGIPVLVAITAIVMQKYLFLYSALCLFVVTAWCGYGVDSWIRKLVKYDSATRFIYGGLFGASFWPVLLSDSPLSWAFALHVLGTACMFDLFGTMLKNEPVIEIGKLQLLVEDLIVYGVGILFGVSMMIG